MEQGGFDVFSTLSDFSYHSYREGNLDRSDDQIISSLLFGRLGDNTGLTVIPVISSPPDASVELFSNNFNFNNYFYSPIEPDYTPELYAYFVTSKFYGV